MRRPTPSSNFVGRLAIACETNFVGCFSGKTCSDPSRRKYCEDFFRRAVLRRCPQQHGAQRPANAGSQPIDWKQLANCDGKRSGFRRTGRVFGTPWWNRPTRPHGTPCHPQGTPRRRQQPPLTEVSGDLGHATATHVGPVAHCGCCARPARIPCQAAALPGNAVGSSRRRAQRAIRPSRRAGQRPYTRGAWRHARRADRGEHGKDTLALPNRLAVVRGAMRHVAGKRAHSA
jgi:hypothetical protein